MAQIKPVLCLYPSNTALMTRNMVIFVPLKLPINRHLALGRQQSVGLREVAAAEEGATRQRRRMGRFQNMVPRPVYKGTLATGEITPQEKDDALTIV